MLDQKTDHCGRLRLRGSCIGIRNQIDYRNSGKYNVDGQFRGKLLELYATCKGHITTAFDEDFGMTPVEAMAAGKPTVAVKEGGYLETVLDGVTGLLVEPDVPSIVKAVKEVSSNPHNYREACIKRSKEFDVSVLLQKMRAMLAP